MGRRCGLAVCLAVLLASGAAQAQQVRLTPENLLKLGHVALAQRDLMAALAYAQALVARDPDDVSAQILLARVQRDLGRLDEAEVAARLAWRGADQPAERFGAALVSAQVASSKGQRTRAQVWLRRAVENAPNDQARQVAITDFGYVRSRNPLSLKVDVAVQPSSNVNNGSSRQIMEFLGIPFELSGDAQALSGVTTSLGVSGRYRLGDGSTVLRFAMTGQAVALSSDAKDQAPDATGADYAYLGLEVGAEKRFLAAIGPVALTPALTLGTNFYGGSALSDYLRLDLTADRALGTRTSGKITLSSERILRKDDRSRSSASLGLSGSVTTSLTNRDQLRLTFGTKRSRSDWHDADYLALSAGVDWQKASPVLGTAVAARLGVETRDFDTSPFSLDGRQDVRLSAGVSVTLRQIDYMGFSPMIEFSASDTRSNIALHDSRDLGVGISIRSNF